MVPLLTQVLPRPCVGLGLAFFDTRAIKSSILERNSFKMSHRIRESLRCGAEGVSAACHARSARGPRRRHAAAYTPHLIDITAARRGDILRRSAVDRGSRYGHRVKTQRSSEDANRDNRDIQTSDIR